jgi:hypothetical protein
MGCNRGHAAISDGATSHVSERRRDDAYAHMSQLAICIVYSCAVDLGVCISLQIDIELGTSVLDTCTYACSYTGHGVPYVQAKFQTRERTLSMRMHTGHAIMRCTHCEIHAYLVWGTRS